MSEIVTNDNQLIIVKNVSKVYKMGAVEITALKNVNLNINRGDFIALMGPSGAGKSTLLHIIGCLDNPTVGEVIIHGEVVQKMKDRKLSMFRNRHIGFIFQSFNLISALNVYENVEYPLVIRGKKVDKEHVLKVIEDVGLIDYLKHRPDELSGGQRQRVAIARALVTNPDIVLADEPTANLDSKTGDKIISLLMELNLKHNVTFLFSTHHDLIAQHAKKIIHILDGELKE
ncbi:MAG: ABC transporter ATP-binding protein [Brevinematales bacterium]